ncbi:MAG: addiction module protein [Chitinophagales bacterium]|nr:addiction module protein [Chitinophagales bacterium]
MNIKEMEHEKLNLITWIAQLQDAKLIQKLKNFRTDNFSIPQWQKEELDKRTKALENGTMKTRSWEEAKKEIFKK